MNSELKPDGVVVKVKPMDVAFVDEFLPRYASAGAAGMDLCACIPESLCVHPIERVKIPTGISVQLPSKDMVALVYARSGLAWRHGLSLSNGVGVVDSDYTGEIQVLMTNFGTDNVVIERGDRIAQLVFTSIYTVQLSIVSQLSETQRGHSGFGSTGVSG